MKTEEEKRLWKQFFKAEKSMFEFVRLNTEVLIENDPPEYIIGEDDREVPPTYVRGVYQFEDSKLESQFLEMLDDYKLKFKNAMGDKFKSYPIRTPEFYKDVMQINISINQAFESIKIIKGDWFPMFFTPANPKILDKAMLDVNTVIKAFNTMGIRAKMGALRKGLTVNISTNDLFAYCKTDTIQARRSSGKQYRALLRHSNQRVAKRIKYGFTVIDSESACFIYRSNPEIKRQHSLDYVGKRISMKEVPYPLIYQLYDK